MSGAGAAGAPGWDTGCPHPHQIGHGAPPTLSSQQLGGCGWPWTWPMLPGHAGTQLLAAGLLGSLAAPLLSCVVTRLPRPLTWAAACPRWPSESQLPGPATTRPHSGSSEACSDRTALACWPGGPAPVPRRSRPCPHQCCPPFLRPTSLAPPQELPVGSGTLARSSGRRSELLLPSLPLACTLCRRRPAPHSLGPHRGPAVSSSKPRVRRAPPSRSPSPPWGERRATGPGPCPQQIARTPSIPGPLLGCPPHPMPAWAGSLLPWL